MKILGLTPKNPNTGETPEEMYLRKLRDLGHDVIITDNCTGITTDIDIIVSMSEVTCEQGYVLSKFYNKPFYAHMEWLPKWRIGIENARTWGESRNYTFKEKMHFIRQYLEYATFWHLADVKTLASPVFYKDMKNFLGVQDLEIESKKLGVDMDKINKYLNETETRPKKENEITCVARFVPHKRIHHIIEALKLIKFDGTFNLVGYGSEQQKYEAIKGNMQIKYFPSSDKFKCMDRSKVTIALWSGLVPAESIYLGTPVVTYDSEYMKDLFSKTLFYAKNNNVTTLAKMIKKVFNFTDDMRKNICNNGIKKIEEGQINTVTQDESVKQLEALIQKAYNKKHKGEK